MKTILITGGAGYVGTHTIVELHKAEMNVVVVDNFENSDYRKLEQVEQKTGKKVVLYRGDFSDKTLLKKVFTDNKIDAVLHLAGYKSVGESVAKPDMYYNNNVVNFKVLLASMAEHGVKSIVFPSSVTTYKTNLQAVPYLESAELKGTSPYADNKIECERILEELYNSDKSWNVVVYRYGNIIGANPDYNIGDNPTSNRTNLLQHIVSHCHDNDFEFTFCGNDFETKDGSGVRDYIDIKDIARANCLALQKVGNLGFCTMNVSNCTGHSVLELVAEFESVCGHKLKYKFASKRPGDVPLIIADNTAITKFGFTPKYSFHKMLEDEYNYREQEHTEHACENKK